MNMETWKPIPSSGGLYEASNLGRIRRINPNGRSNPDGIVSQSTLPAGYKLVRICMGPIRRARLVHRLVCEAFLGPPPPGHEVNHKDSNKANNQLSNLEYLTRSQNLLHCVENTGAYRGERNSQASITEKDVVAMRDLHKQGLGYKRISKKLGISWNIVRGVLAGLTWKHVR